MKLVGILAAALCLFASVAVAAEETGMITARAGEGFWARFAQPVAEGGQARIRAFRGGDVVGVARIAWASRQPPYEAYLVGVRARDTGRRVSNLTPYEALTQDRPLAEMEPLGAEIVSGAFVTAASGRSDYTGDPLDGVIRALLARPGVRRVPAGRPARQREAAIAEMLTPGRVWADPVTARLVQQARDLLAERGGMGGTVPGGWFPADLAKQKTETPATGPLP